MHMMLRFLPPFLIDIVHVSWLSFNLDIFVYLVSFYAFRR